MSGPEFAYVQARLQARHGRRPDVAAWQVLEASHTPGHFLALARAGRLAPWVDGLDDSADAHRIERHLRQRWQGYVADVSRWLPASWQPAARWFGSLPDLPLSSHAQAGDDTGADWLDAWLRLVPPDDRLRAPLRRVATLLMPGLSRPGSGPGPEDRTARSAAAGPEQRALLDLFRHQAATAVAVFAHLALVALDLERLRGGLVTRRLFDPAPSPAGASQGA